MIQYTGFNVIPLVLMIQYNKFNHQSTDSKQRKELKSVHNYRGEIITEKIIIIKSVKNT